MKRIISLLLAMMLIVASTTTFVTAEVTNPTEVPTSEPTQTPEPEYNFKTFRWGDSVETVKAVEGEPLDDLFTEDNSDTNAFLMGYETNDVGLDILTLYLFSDDGLYEVGHIALASDSNDLLHIKNELVEEYGEPTWEVDNWENASEKSYCAIWQLDRTTITVVMLANSDTITAVVDYKSTVISPDKAGLLQ